MRRVVPSPPRSAPIIALQKTSPRPTSPSNVHLTEQSDQVFYLCQKLGILQVQVLLVLLLMLVFLTFQGIVAVAGVEVRMSALITDS